MHTRRPSLGLALVLIGSTLFIVNAGVSRVALRAGVDPAQLTTVRMTGTVVVLLLIVLVVDRSALRPPAGRLRWLLVVHGVVGVAGFQWAYFIAIDRLPVGMALLLEYQAPVLVALWAWLVQGEQVHPRLWLGLALAMAGLAASTGIWRGLEFDPIGILAGCAAAVCFAVYFLIGEHGVGEIDPLRVAFWSFLFGTVAINLVEPITKFPVAKLDDPVDLLGAPAGAEPPLWLVLAWIVVLGTVTPFCVELVALRHLSATIVTTVAMLEPIGVAALGWAWFDESLDTVAIVGVVAVVTGVILAQSSRRFDAEHPIPHPPPPLVT